MIRRLGIVLSVLWLIAFPVWAYKRDSDSLLDQYGFRLRICHLSDDEEFRPSEKWVKKCEGRSSARF
jgi:hypothetical protein